MSSRRITIAIVGTALIALAGWLVFMNLRQGAVIDELQDAPARPSTVSEPKTVPLDAVFVRIDGTTIVAAIERTGTVGQESFIERTERKFTMTDQTPVVRLYRYPDQTVEELPTRPADIRPGERLIIHVSENQKDAPSAQAVRIYITY